MLFAAILMLALVGLAFTIPTVTKPAVRPRWLALSGLIFGLLALTRPEGVLVFGFCVFYLLKV